MLKTEFEARIYMMTCLFIDSALSGNSYPAAESTQYTR